MSATRFNEVVAGERGARAVVVMRSDGRRNEDVLLAAATAAIHREGLKVPLATIAAEAGVGIGTLYRHFATRDDLLVALTHRSFEQVLDNARRAERSGRTPADALRRFVEAGIRQRNELVLPLHGGPPVTAPDTLRLRSEVHRIVEGILSRGAAEGSLQPGLAARDVIAFGSMLAQPRSPDRHWDALCRRLLDHYLDGLAPR